MLSPPTIDFYTQAAVAKILRWSRQRVWIALKSQAIPSVKTMDDPAVVLVPKDALVRLVALKPEPSRPRPKRKAKR